MSENSPGLDELDVGAGAFSASCPCLPNWPLGLRFFLVL